MNKDVNIEDVHTALLEMLVEFDRICRKHNLIYYMIGGTLLGAVRHHGFIPWDDDIDIGMPRPDYERFVKLSQMEFPSNLQVWNLHKKSKGYMLNFSKLVNVNTSMVPVEHPDCIIGLFLDIFPIDGVSKFSFLRKSQVKSIHFFQVLRSHKYLSKHSRAFSWKSFSLKLLSSILSNYIHWIIDKLVTVHKYSASDYAGNLLGVYSIKEIVSKDVFGEPVELEFGGYLFYAPQKYDLWLKNVYGDYMELPPLDKRNTTHEYASINLKRSCFDLL